MPISMLFDSFKLKRVPKLQFKAIWVLKGSSLCTSPGISGAQAIFWRAVLVCLVLGCFGVVVTSFSAMLLSWSMMFWMLVAVVLSLFGLSENISLLYTLYSPTRCRASQSSRTCFGSPPARHMLCRYGSGICFCSCFSLAAFLFWL